MTLILLQQTLLDTPDSLAAQVTPESTSLLDTMLRGGWVMLPIFLLSILAIYLFIERLIVLRKAKANPEQVTDKIRAFVHSGDIRGAIRFCENENKPITHILRTGLERLGRPIQEIQDAVQAQGRYEAFELEKRTDLLASIAGIAPMLVAISRARSRSLVRASPSSMRQRSWYSQPEPSRQGVHWPQDSCL